MFDSFGYVGPVIVTAKILMQELWVNKIGWDDELPDILLEKMQKIYIIEKSTNSKVGVTIKRNSCNRITWIFGRFNCRLWGMCLY